MALRCLEQLDVVDGDKGRPQPCGGCAQAMDGLEYLSRSVLGSTRSVTCHSCGDHGCEYSLAVMMVGGDSSVSVAD